MVAERPFLLLDLVTRSLHTAWTRAENLKQRSKEGTQESCSHCKTTVRSMDELESPDEEGCCIASAVSRGLQGRALAINTSRDKP